MAKWTRSRGVKVIDDQTLEVTLEKPVPYFLAKLTYPTSFVVDSEQVESDDAWWEAPNASGPYQVFEYTENEVLIIQRNPAFYNPPEFQYAIYQILLSGSVVSYFESGALDISAIGSEDIQRAPGSGRPAPSLSLFCPGHVHLDGHHRQHHAAL